MIQSAAGSVLALPRSVVSVPTVSRTSGFDSDALEEAYVFSVHVTSTLTGDDRVANATVTVKTTFAEVP